MSEDLRGQLEPWTPIFVNGVIPTEFIAWVDRYKDEAVRQSLINELDMLPRSGFINADGIRFDVVSLGTINGRLAELKSKETPNE